ncbi:porin [Aquisalimonas sp.]|uniref:porin n=1 Tax=Aquisalimonas sp. TaxID=1872621 RepID=UPI0025C3133D|nr:porin [Aquisalimonas sp.]
MSNHTLKATAVGSVSALALAALSTTAHADGPELYGAVDIGLESYSADDEAPQFIFSGLNTAEGDLFRDPDEPGRADDRDFLLSNAFQSRLGVRGGEDLTDNLRASYNIEFSVDVLDEDGGGFSDAVGTRLGWVALSGDWGMAKIGTQWMALYEFGGWNAHRAEVHGYGTYFYTTGVLRDSLGFGFRQGSAVSYQYGSAWGHSDPFALNITAGIGEGPDNESGISSIQVAGQYSFMDMFSINAVVIQEIVDVEEGINDDEATLFNVGARWSVTPEFELGANYTFVTDYFDGVDADSDRDSIALAAFYDFGLGWDGQLGIATASADDIPDIDFNVYGFVRYAFTERTNTYLEFEHIDYDNDTDETIGMLAVQHNF